MTARNLDLPDESRLQLRIGINLGDVFHEGEDVFGDGVNIAARLVVGHFDCNRVTQAQSSRASCNRQAKIEIFFPLEGIPRRG